MSAAPHATRLAAAAIVAAGVLAGCGGAPDHAATHAAATRRPPAQEHHTPLVSIWRNLEFSGIPEDMTVYSNGEVHYRNLLHTQVRIKILTAKLRPTQLAKLRRLLADVDLDRADASALRV